MGKVKKTLNTRAKRSHVWKYFKADAKEKGVNRCTVSKCTFSTKLKEDGCTNAMLVHLKKAHSIFGPKKEDVEKAIGTIEKAIDMPWYVKTEGEWLALLLIEDGFSFHAITHSRFVRAAFHYMKLKIFT